jgi:ABC-type multidrug transport system ATPase subunit
MDPVNRRHVWSFIEEFKKGRIVVLTTHSMEEADILGDRIAIMAHGRLRALGNSIQLKNKYGTGYRFSLNTDPLQSNLVNKMILDKLPDAKLEDSTAGSMIYQLPRDKSTLIPDFVQYVESDPEIKSTMHLYI